MAVWKKILVEGLDLTGSDVTNNSFTVSDSEESPNTSPIGLGDTLTFAASGDLSVVENAGTVTYSFTSGAVTNAFTTINAPSGTDPVAASATDTLNLTNGNGITITGNETTDTIDIKVTDNGIDTLQLAAGAVTFAEMAGAAVITAVETIASNDVDNAFPTSAAVIDYVAAQVTAQDLDLAGDSGTGAVGLDSQSLLIAGTANEIETSASGQTITIGLPNDVTITGNLTVNGTQTILNTETLTVDDDIIVINDNAAAITAQGGFELKTNSTTKSALLWNAASGTQLTGWVASPSATDNSLTNYVSVMEFGATAATLPTGDAGGIGAFHFNTSDEALYIRIS